MGIIILAKQEKIQKQALRTPNIAPWQGARSHRRPWGPSKWKTVH